jgi:2-polyprenyl-6-methoxyphenol hydroxylase-like FAD-dependent oxidoreductase
MQSVLISGAGIAGPTLAYWLVASGYTPTLVERAPRLREGGYVIDFWGLGFDIAERMGLLPELKRQAYWIDELRFVDRRGRRVGGFPVDVFRKMTSGRYISLPRSALAAVIYGAIAGRCETIFNDSISSIETTNDGLVVTFESSRRRQFDLVVGADGLHSTVRRLAFGPENRFERYLGYGLAAFEVSRYRPRDDGIYVSYGLPGKQIGRFALRDDRTLFLIVFRAPQERLADARDSYAQRALLRAVLSKGGWECAAIRDAADHAEPLYFDMISQIHLDHWSKERVALIGDAAFAPSLLAGQGSALAMTSAYVLAGELAATNGDHSQAFERYERVLRDFIDAKQVAAERFAASFAPSTPTGLFVRNQLSKAFRFPFIADLLIGRGLLDRLTLPVYRFDPRPRPTDERRPVERTS